MSVAQAQPYPSRPIIMVVPFGAGGPVDTVARILGERPELANRLQRRLMAQQNRAWEFDLEEGILDPARLSRVAETST